MPSALGLDGSNAVHWLSHRASCLYAAYERGRRRRAKQVAGTGWFYRGISPRSNHRYPVGDISRLLRPRWRASYEEASGPACIAARIVSFAFRFSGLGALSSASAPGRPLFAVAHDSSPSSSPHLVASRTVDPFSLTGRARRFGFDLTDRTPLEAPLLAGGPCCTCFATPALAQHARRSQDHCTRRIIYSRHRPLQPPPPPPSVSVPPGTIAHDTLPITSTHSPPVTGSPWISSLIALAAIATIPFQMYTSENRSRVQFPPSYPPPCHRRRDPR